MRELREQKGWSQTELAVRAGVSINTIVNAEKHRPIRLAMKMTICQALEVGIDDVDIVVHNPVRARNAK
jgi:DNA-binding XRE family transcriptional regulator